MKVSLFTNTIFVIHKIDRNRLGRVSMKINKKGKIIVIAIALILVLGGSVGGYLYYDNMKKMVNRDVIYEGITIHGIDVGGMTKEDALKVLGDYIVEDNLSKKIVLNYEDKNWVMNYEDWGFKSNMEEIVDEAYTIGKDGSLRERYKTINSLLKDKISYDLKFVYDQEFIDKILNHIETSFINEPKNAIIEKINGQFVITEEVNGYELDKEASKAKVKEKLDAKEEGQVELVIKKYTPDVTKDMLEHVKDVLGTFHTNFGNDDPGRNTNLQVAANMMNGTLIMPGEVFSVMKSIGPVDSQHGYKNAPIIVNGKLVPGIGGGICQIATTVFNAVLLSELEIVERSNHSMPVGYVPLGQDATVSGTVVDFKFRNNKEYPLYVESYLANNKLHVTIYGDEQRSATRKVKFVPVVLETIPAPPGQIEYDSTLPKGQQFLKLAPKKGYRVKLLKEIYDNDTLVKTEVAAYSYYRPRASVTVLGQKVVEVSTDITPQSDPEDIDFMNMEEDIFGEEQTQDGMEQMEESTEIEDVNSSLDEGMETEPEEILP